MALSEEHYRREAAKLRAMADECGDDRLGKKLRALATDYEGLADRAVFHAMAGNKPASIAGRMV